jgi:hypothetical protein
VLAFSDFDRAVAGLESLDRRYEYHHCRAAREIVEQFFAADKVLISLVERSFASDLPKVDETPGEQPAPNRESS